MGFKQKLSLVTCWLVPLSCMMMASTSALADTNTTVKETVNVSGKWLRHENGNVIKDPQTSGLVIWRDQLLTLSDRSALLKHQRALHRIEKHSARVGASAMPMRLSVELEASCFAKYLSNTPDLEALVVDPANDKVFYTVTEDASYDPLTPACAKQWLGSGSTAFPTLLVRMELNEDYQLTLTHARPLQYKPEFAVGNFPNDGIEGLAFAKNRWLYLALEKDKKKYPRIFRLKMDADFWKVPSFIAVEDPELLLPKGDVGAFPLNGMDYYPSKKGGHGGYLIAAARNNDQLWIIDLNKQRPTKMIDMSYWVNTADASCSAMETIPFTAIEGVAVDGERLWLINDPWKAHYLENIQCKSNAQHFRDMAPLLFSLPIDKGWFQ
ncbi:hypothetical protein QX776_08660 [Alteromonadaceae bacterium BrNp21-10]|nr:hypothetical protein [Alteromonadaceae bacterium BrNp21-10]